MPKSKGGFVYILASKPNGTLYVGVTSDIVRRVHQHRNGEGSEFVAKYDVTRLVYLERYDDIEDAIRHEKQLKPWRREWKLEPIREHNPTCCTRRPVARTARDRMRLDVSPRRHDPHRGTTQRRS